MARRPGVWYLQNLQLFEKLPVEAVTSAGAKVTVRQFAKREMCSFAADNDYVTAVAQGAAKLYRPGLLGRQVTEAVLFAGDLFGCIAGRERTAVRQHLEMLEPTTLVLVPRTTMTQLIRSHPDFAYTVVQMLEDRQRTLQRRLESLAFKDVRQRVVETVVELARVHGDKCDHGWAVDVRITQQDLADLVGATRQAVSKVLRELELKCYLARKKRLICIVSLTRLVRLGEKLANSADSHDAIDFSHATEA